jgi:GNAT superfamily N-acetyltransferase
MHMILENFSADSIINAMEVNLQEAWTHFGRWIGANLHDEPEMTWFDSDYPFQLANGIVRAQFSPDSQAQKLDERIQQLSAEHVAMACMIGPSTRPADLGERLQAHGWILDDAAPGMAIDLQILDDQTLTSSPITIERANNAEMLKTWLRVMTVGSEIPEAGRNVLLDIVSKQGFKDIPHVHCYLGWLEGEPVATSLLFLAGGVAGIYNVATLPAFRGQGIGSALTVAPLLDARARGYKIGVLQSSPMGLNLYKRLGFKEYCAFNAYFWEG